MYIDGGTNKLFKIKIKSNQTLSENNNQEV
jgi:hypothetical protein